MKEPVTDRPLKLIKFIIPKEPGIADPDNPSLTWSGMLAVTIAPDIESARAAARKYADEFGFDARWIGFAKVIELELSGPKCVAWAAI